MLMLMSASKGAGQSEQLSGIEATMEWSKSQASLLLAGSRAHELTTLCVLAVILEKDNIAHVIG